MVSGLGSCVFCFGLVVRSGLCHLRCEEKWLADHLGPVFDIICSIVCRMRCMNGGLTFLGARGVLPTSIELVGEGQVGGKRTVAVTIGDASDAIRIRIVFF